MPLSALLRLNWNFGDFVLLRLNWNFGDAALLRLFWNFSDVAFLRLNLIFGDSALRFASPRLEFWRHHSAWPQLELIPIYGWTRAQSASS